MNGRRTVVGLSLLSALALLAFAAPSASAGRTLFTCVKGGSTDFSDEHCTKEVTPGNGTYGHLAIKEGTSTKLVADNVATLGITVNAVLKTTINKANVEVVCTKALEEGTATNEVVKEAMQSVGSKISIKYSECTMPKPEGEGCKIKGGKVEIPNAKSTTFEKEAELEWGVKFEPTEGTKLGEVPVEGCKNKELNKTYSLEGTLRAIPEGATTYFTVPVTEKELKVSGQKASLENTTTMRMAPPPEKPEVVENPVAYTKTIP